VAYIVDLFPRRSPRPTTTWEITHRIAAILFGDRTEYDQKFCNAVTHHLKFVRQLHGLVDGLPPGVAQQAQKLVQQIEREYRQLEKKPYVPLRVQRIQRRAGSGEYVSADIDFSLARIDELMEQGEADAAEQLTHAA
jgi:hypothetical protein